jgi:type IV secretory pathway TraG/TraD family ATPase VirD4
MLAMSPLLDQAGLMAGQVLGFMIGTSASVALGYNGGRAGAAEHRSAAKAYQRGSRVTDAPRSDRGRDALQHVRTRAAGAQVTLAGATVPLADETKHFKLIGTTGTGKSTAIAELLGAALARGDRAVIADPDGGYLARFYDPSRGDVILNPFDRRSVKWDLFREIDEPYDVEQLARSLIPDHDGADRSWRGYARTFFGAVTRQCHESGRADMADLYNMLVVADTAEIRGLVKGTPAQPFLDEHNSRMFDSIRSVTSSAVGSLEYVAAQQGTPFSVRQWVRGGSPGVLFMPYQAGQIAALRSTISAWMRLAIFETMNQPEQRLWFVVDELDALGQIDGLKDALARLRKFGGRCVLGFQSVSQVSSTYGQGDAHTIVENCANTLILRCSASEGGGTARFASQLIGEREVLRTTISRSSRPTDWMDSVSRSQQYSVEPAVMPSEIEQLPDLAGYLKQASSPAWQRVRLDAVRRWNESRPDAGPAAARVSTGAER